jgi:hypothetical protein
MKRINLAILAVAATFLPTAALPVSRITDGTPKATTQVQAGPLTSAERTALLLMREEEKLAFDVYTFLHAKWNVRVFENISAAEQTHMDAMKTLLDKYGIPDPIGTAKPGIFKDPNLQKLYNELTKTGSESRTNALGVGATIEDLDIFDLARITKEMTREDIKLVFSNLERGSRNHLRAFVRNLKRSGIDYKPKYISQADFDKIIASPNERGG